MNHEKVECTQTYNISSGLLWEIVNDFYSDWHPVMTWCKEEANQVRYFEDIEGNQYREQLIDFSNHKKAYSYIMLEGISNLDSYTGLVKVETLSADSSKLTWSAEIKAEQASQIAKGTKAVFEMGLAKLTNIIQDNAIQTQFIQTSSEGAKLAIDSAGKGELCLFLHGIGGNRSNWSNQLVALSESCQAVALDIRGYGNSQLGNDGITVDIVNDDIFAIMKHFQADKLHLVGLSFGSWLAASFADGYPEKVASLTLSAGSTGMSEAGQEKIDGFTNARLIPVRNGLTPAKITDIVVEQVSGPHTTEDTKDLLHTCMTTLPRETYLAALTCFLSPPKKLAFTHFNFPTLFISGEHDKLAPPKEMQAVAARVPNSHFIEIPNAGHLLNLDCPEAYNYALLNFLKKVMV